MKRILPLSMIALSSCSSGDFSPIGCLTTQKGFVIVKADRGGALDGTDYIVCTSTTPFSCDKYNELRALRPIGLHIDVRGAAITIRQSGGSVGSFATDPVGMVNPSYKRSMPIEFVYKPTASAGGITYFIDGKPVGLHECH
jgi:hypothetical protein